MLITQTESNPYTGRMLIGKLWSGSIALGDKLHGVSQEGTLHEMGKVLKITKRYGTTFIDIDKAFAGDIVSVAGFNNITVGHTINSPGKTFVIPVSIRKTTHIVHSYRSANSGNRITCQRFSDSWNRRFL